MSKPSFLRFFFSRTYFYCFVIAQVSILMSFYNSIHYEFIGHKTHDFSIQTISFDYLKSNYRGKSGHIFEAYRENKEIMAFWGSHRVPELKVLKVKDLPDAGSGYAYYVRSVESFWGGEIQILVGVKFDRELMIGLNQTPKNHQNRVLAANRRIWCRAAILWLIAMIYPIYQLRKYKETYYDKAK